MSVAVLWTDPLLVMVLFSVQCSRWYLSASHARPRSSVAKKPYNPILGDIFRYYYNLPNEKHTTVSYALVVCQEKYFIQYSSFYKRGDLRGIRTVRVMKPLENSRWLVWMSANSSKSEEQFFHSSRLSKCFWRKGTVHLCQQDSNVYRMLFWRDKSTNMALWIFQEFSFERWF